MQEHEELDVCDGVGVGVAAVLNGKDGVGVGKIK
jgi:hypothetical protein